jgi:hypothetical protein
VTDVVRSTKDGSILTSSSSVIGNFCSTSPLCQLQYISLSPDPIVGVLHWAYKVKQRAVALPGRRQRMRNIQCSPWSLGNVERERSSRCSPRALCPWMMICHIAAVIVPGCCSFAGQRTFLVLLHLFLIKSLAERK